LIWHVTTLYNPLLHTLVSTFTFLLLLLGSGFQRWTFASSGFLNRSQSQLIASNSNTSRQLNSSSPLTNSLPDWLTTRSQSQSYYIMTNSQSASLSWYKTLVWGPRPGCCYCQTVADLLMWDALSDERIGLSFTIAACLHQQSFLSPSPTGHMTIFYCLRFETHPTWRARSLYLHPPGTGWPSYTPRSWVPFSLPSMTRRAMMEVSVPTSMQG
jgi:hypothetical protein